MNAAAAVSASTEPVVIRSPNLLVRALTVADVSDRFVSWFLQDDIRSSLNLPAQGRTKADMIAYVQSFDQQTKLLLGIFDAANELLVGFFTIQIEPRIGRYLVSTIVGEPDYRTKGLMLEITLPFREYFFETRGLKVMTATALASNKAIIGYFEKTGWTLNHTLKAHTKSHADGTMIDLHLYSITREAWQAWKAANPAMVDAMAKGLLPPR